jgi:hypothetical protein
MPSTALQVLKTKKTTSEVISWFTKLSGGLDVFHMKLETLKVHFEI